MNGGKPYFCSPHGELAQLARALAWHARGRRFDSDILHALKPPSGGFFIFLYSLSGMRIPDGEIVVELIRHASRFYLNEKLEQSVMKKAKAIEVAV